MDNITLKIITNNLLVPFGFNKNGSNTWIRKAEEISMKVYLQKSSFSNSYYFHAYYVVNNMQTKNPGENECFAGVNYSDYKLLLKMCDLEYDIPDDEREKGLRDLINKDFSNHHFIETEKELKEMIVKKAMPVLLALKKYLKMD